MADKNNNLKFDIPKSIILLAYIFCWPVGVVLTILRCISIPINKQGTRIDNSENVRRNADDHAEERSDRRGKKRSKLHKASAATVWSRVIAAVAFIAALILTAAAAAEGYASGFTSGLNQLLITAVPALAVSGVSLTIASKLFGARDSRMGRIRAIIGNRESINLTKLSMASNESLKSVRSDLQKMIDNGEFGEYAYIDLGTNNFMRSPYSEPDDPERFDYRDAYGDILKNGKNKKAKQAEENQVDQDTEASDVSSDSDDYDRIINEIRRLNDEIADEEVSDRIYKIEEHTRNIFDYVTDHPDAKPQIRTFMNYYLPTTLKLLESYSRIERVGVAGENMRTSKKKIEDILDLLVIGFEQQVDQLFKNESIDISSDISVLETMMQKDGLNGHNDFDVSKVSEELLNSYSDEISDSFGDFGAAAQAAPTAPEGKNSETK